MSAQPAASSLPTLHSATWVAGVMVAAVLPLAMIVGWAPGSYLLTCILAGMITAGLFLRFFRTRNRLWLNVNFLYMVLPVAQLYRHFDVPGWAHHAQGICISLLPTLLLFTLGRSWVERLRRDPSPQADSSPSSPV